MKTEKKILYVVRREIDFCRQVFRSFKKDNGFMVAAALSFYTFLSLIPLLLLAVAIFAYFLGSPKDAQDVVFNYLIQYMPYLAEKGGSDVGRLVEEVVRGKGIATGFSLIIILWTGTTMISNLSTAVNVAWDIDEDRSFLKKRGLALVILIATFTLLGISFLATAFMQLIQKFEIFGITAGDVHWIWGVLSYLLPLLISITTFAIIYKVLPNTYVNSKVAVIGGVFAGLLWDIAKTGFSYYIARFAAYNQIYGSLGGIIILLIWINYTAIVTVLGAEFASEWAKRHRMRPIRHRD